MVIDLGLTFNCLAISSRRGPLAKSETAKCPSRILRSAAENSVRFTGLALILPPPFTSTAGYLGLLVLSLASGDMTDEEE